MRRFVSLAVAGVIASLGRTAPADGPFFMGLGDLPGGGYHSTAYGMSANGSTVVGYSYCSDPTRSMAFRWSLATGMIGLGYLPGGEFSGNAYDASADGAVIVGHSHAGGSRYEAFRWTEDAGMIGIGHLPGGGESYAHGVSADGSVVVGDSDTSTSYDLAFRWTEADGMVALPVLPGGDDSSLAFDVSADGAITVGWSDSAPGVQACRWTPDGPLGLGDLPGGEFRSLALAVSADGVVIAGRSKSELCGPGGWEAFRWIERRGMTGLGDLPGGEFCSFARDISADGSIIVGTGTDESGRQAFIWDADHGMRALAEVLTSEYGLDLSGWHLESAAAISADALTIAGFGTNPNGETEAWITHIPEPASVCLLAFGLSATLRRRR